MKNIAHSFIMIFLFGIICPSYQAYAEGKVVSIIIEKEQKKIKLMVDLSDKLATDKVFEELFNKIFILSIYTNINLSLQSEKEIERIKERVEVIKSKNEITFSDGDEVYKLLGFNDSNMTTTFDKKVENLKTKLKQSFPELTLLTDDEFKNVATSAIEKGNLQSKAEALLTRDECFQNARNAYAINSTTPFWGRGAVIALIVVCLIAVIACAVVLVIFTAGAAFGAATAMLPYSAGCVGAAGVFYGLAAAAVQERANTIFTNSNTSCLDQFGGSLGEGKP
jgi:hypothetical protein